MNEVILYSTARVCVCVSVFSCVRSCFCLCFLHDWNHGGKAWHFSSPHFSSPKIEQRCVSVFAWHQRNPLKNTHTHTYTYTFTVVGLFWQLNTNREDTTDMFLCLFGCYFFCSPCLPVSFFLFLCVSASRSLSLGPDWGVLRGDDHGAGRIRNADRLPAEQLQRAAAAVHGPGVRLIHRSGGRAHTQYVIVSDRQQHYNDIICI